MGILETISLYFKWVPLGAVLLFTVASGVFGIYFLVKIKPRLPEKLKRGALTSGYQIFQQQLVMAALILASIVFTGITLENLGVSMTFNPLLALLCGFVIYFVVLGIIELVSHLIGKRERLHDLSFETMRSIWPRNPSEKKLAFVAVCLVNPFTEEIIYRGFLIHFLSETVGYVAVIAIAGLAISVAAHLYQGAWAIPFHIFFHGVAVLILFSPLGLIGCFGLHIAGDIFPVLSLRKNMDDWKLRKQRDKKNRRLSYT